MSRSKIPFEPLREGSATVYTCGPTVDRRIHLGNAGGFCFQTCCAGISNTADCG